MKGLNKLLLGIDATIKSKAQSNLRWLVLVAACLMMVGNYYCYDNPAALHTQLEQWVGKPSNYETLFSLLYTVYSIPNCFLPFFGGYFVDRLGVRMCLAMFVAFITIGQIVFALGVSLKSWPVMFLGRVIYGFGGESLGVGNSALLSNWFKGKELAFAFGVNLSIARLGSVFNNFMSPFLANSVNLKFSVWFGTFLCGISFFNVLIISIIDNGMDAVLKKKGIISLNEDNNDEENKDDSNDELRTTLLSDQEGSMRSVAINSTDEINDSDNKVQFSDALTFRHAFWVLAVSCVVVYGCILPFNNIASALLLQRDYFIKSPSNCELSDPYQCQSSTNGPNYANGCPVSNCPGYPCYAPPLPLYAKINDITYVQSNLTTLIDCTDSNFKDSNSCTYDYCNTLSDAEDTAAAVMSIPYTISACLCPILGYLVDRFGKRAVIATVAPLVLVIVHSLLGFSTVRPVGPLIGQGLAYSFFAAVLWPSVPLVMEQKFIGLGYGIVTSIQNGGLAIFPLIISLIVKRSDNNYIPNAEIFFISLAALGTIVGMYLNYYDYNNDNIFNSSGKKLDNHNNNNNNNAYDDNDERVKLYAAQETKSVVQERSSSTSKEIFTTQLVK